MSKTRPFAATAILATLLTLGSGCWRVHYTTDKPRGITYVQNEHYFLYGLIGKTVVDVRRLCPDGASDIVRYAGPIDVLFWALTLGIYTPAKHAITCAVDFGPGAAAAEQGAWPEAAAPRASGASAAGRAAGGGR